MQKINISDRTKQRALVYWEQAKEDWKVAEKNIKENPEKSCLLSTQGAMNALSSILTAKGFFQIPAYSTIELLDQCTEINSTFEELRAPCTILDGMLEKDLFGHTKQKSNRVTPAFAKACFRAGKEIQEFMKKYLKNNPSN